MNITSLLTSMIEAVGKCAHSWSIAWICCFINFLLLGVSRLSGLLYLASISRFGVERSNASLPFVLCYTVKNFLGPLIGYVACRFELRLLIASGCFLSALGAGACYFAEDITTVTVLWGGVHGLGFGLGTNLIPQVLNQHFEKYISIANGIALGGECVAGLVLPVIVVHFLDTYGTSGTFLILSGLILHGVPAALLLKSPKSVSKQSGDNISKEKYQHDSVENACIEDGCHKKDHSLKCDVVEGQGKCSGSSFENNQKENCFRCPLASNSILDINSYPKSYKGLKKSSYYLCSKDNLSSPVSGAADSYLILRHSKQSSYRLNYETGTISGNAVNHNFNFGNIADSDVCKDCIVLQSDVTNSATRSSLHYTYCHHSKSGVKIQSSTKEESHLNRIPSQHPTDFPSSLEEDASVHATVKSDDIIHCENQTIKQSNLDIHCETQTTNPSNDSIRCENTTIKPSNDDIYHENRTTRPSNDGTHRASLTFQQLDNIHCKNTTIKQSKDGIHCENTKSKQSDNIHCENTTMRQSDDNIHCVNTTTTQSNQEEDAPKRSAFHAFRVFLDPAFFLILFPQGAIIFIYTSVMTVIVDFARDAGVSGHEEVYVLMCLAVSDLIGRFGLGWVTDLKYMSNIAFSAIFYAGTAILMVALVYLRSFLSIMTIAFLFGLFLAGILITGPGIIRDFIEEDKVTMALASRCFLYAPMSLTQSSLIGFFRGKLGSYNGLFYILGFISFLCCIFSLLVPCAFKWRSRKSTSNSKT